MAPAIRKKLRLIVPLAYMVGILMLSSIEQSAVPDVDEPLRGLSPLLQNLLHIPLYAILAGIGFWALAGYTEQRGYKTGLTLLMVLAFSIIDETYQATVPGRTSSLMDVALDVTGGILALVVLTRMGRPGRQRKQNPAAR
jgi:VanZ family protein